MGALFARFGTWIVSLFADKLLALLGSLISHLINSFKNKQKDKIDDKNSDKLQDVLKDPTKTEQDIENATGDFLNGRKP